MLRVRDLSCARNQRQLFRALAFTLEPGQLLQVVGGNGSGKSTLLRILMGLYTEFSGGIDWSLDEPPLYLGHRPGIEQALTVSENLRWIARLREQAVTDEDVKASLLPLGLATCRDTLCARLSEGQRKRVSLARFLLCRNRCWVMDEPFSAIDAQGLSTLRECLEQQVDQGGAVIFSSHEPVTLQRPLRTLEL